MLKLKSNLKLLDLRAPKKLSLMILISHDVVRHDGIHEKRVNLLKSHFMSTGCPRKIDTERNLSVCATCGNMAKNYMWMLS